MDQLYFLLEDPFSSISLKCVVGNTVFGAIFYVGVPKFPVCHVTRLRWAEHLASMGGKVMHIQFRLSENFLERVNLEDGKGDGRITLRWTLGRSVVRFRRELKLAQDGVQFHVKRY
jgi:hypothetical protein